MRPLLANTRGSAGMPAWAESFSIDEFDNGVVRRVLGEVDQFVLGHGKTGTLNTDMTICDGAPDIA